MASIGSSGDTRYALTGNFFNQVGMIPGQGYTRGAAFALDRPHVGPTQHRPIAELVAHQHGSGRRRRRVRLRARHDVRSAARRTSRIPIPPACYDPRPDDDPLNINPVLEAQSVTRQQIVNRVFGSAYAELKIADGLTYRMNVGPDYTALGNGCYNGPWTHGNCTNLGANSSNQGQPPQAGQFNQPDFNYTVENLLRYNKNVGSQHFDFTGLYSIQHDRFNKDSLYATNLPYTTQLWYDLGSGTAGNEVSRISEWSLESYMGRLNYTLKDRYSLSVTGRTDGSSRFAPGHKWTFFPSVGLGWQLGDEAFMQRFTFLSSLKVRGSYGTTGNTAINPYQTQGTLSREALYVRHDEAFAATSPAAFRIRTSAGKRPIRRTSVSTTRSSTIASPARIDAYKYRYARPAAHPASAGDVGLHVDAPEHRLDGEHRHRALALDAEPAQLARRDVDDRLLLVEEQEQDHGARQRRDVGRRQRLVRRSADQRRRQPGLLRLQVRRRVAVCRLGRDEGVQRQRQHVQVR